MDLTMLPIDMTQLYVQHECNQHASFQMVYVYCVPCNPCLSVCYPNLCTDWIHCCLCNFVWKCIFIWNCQYDLWCFSRNCTLIFSIYGVFLHLRLFVQLVSIVFMYLVSKSCSRLKEYYRIALHMSLIQFTVRQITLQWYSTFASKLQACPIFWKWFVWYVYEMILWWYHCA